MLAYYNDNAGELFDLYQSLDPEQLHGGWKIHLPAGGGLALDVGSGSGRDAAWLAAKGWDVVAVEPAARLRSRAQEATKSLNIVWLDDSLPSLSSLRKRQFRFSFILVGGVFMHLTVSQQRHSFETLTRLMAENALMVITLRHGPDTHGRKFHSVSAEDIVKLARQKSFRVDILANQKDRLARQDVSWQVILVWN